jgi:hypothetical protein
MKHTDPRYPNTGDILGCSDGDIGIVLRTYFDGDRDALMVEVAWNSRPRQPLTDPWDAEDFSTADDLFHIMSRA